MGITTKHEDYDKYLPRWCEMEDSLDEQDTIRDKGEHYLPMTSGMKRSKEGLALYEAYKKRARYYGVVRQTLTGIIGLMFDKDPDGTTDDVVTRSGQTNLQLARDVARDVASYGRSVLVIDAPKPGAANPAPFIQRYSPQSLINWKIDPDNPSEFRLAVLHELWESETPSNEFVHEYEDRYRVYRHYDGVVSVGVYDSDGDVVEEVRPLPTDFIPVIAVGSISVDPDCDPVPLLPVKDCAIAIYQISADLRQDLYLTGQKQGWMSGCSDEQYSKNIEAGYGAGSWWYLGHEGRAGLIESSGSSYSDASTERDHEFDQASSYAVNLVQQSDSTESGRALEIRAAAQHASIYTMADSVSIGVDKALRIRAKWAAQPEPEDFAIRTEFTDEEAADQMINALNSAINSGNAPRSALFEVLRRNGLTEKTNDELQSEIDAQREYDDPDDEGDDDKDDDESITLMPGTNSPRRQPEEIA